MKKVSQLPVFHNIEGVLCISSVEATLRLQVIRKVVCCALGPLGNNIEQAAHLWLERLGIADKGEVVLRDTPEECLALARTITDDGVVAVFWTCAVYAHENEFFFGNPDVYPFYFQQEIPLDEMQLTTRSEMKDLIIDGEIPIGWQVASHPSPAPLMNDSRAVVVLQNSNAAAAKICAEGGTELCITTEKARRIYGLVKIHSFGSPNMVFFGGITQHGLDQLKKAYEEEPWL
ncbi:MAG: hypothetical protein NTY81_00720 [Candidatus Staskawiczbacteria bacterium]|nr:hypothetical protein [Candidatus Staskawiczbacteria bacterium]